MKTMRTAATRMDQAPKVFKHAFKHVTYHEHTNSIMVVYGRDRTPKDCINIQGVGSHVSLVSQEYHTICILRHKAHIKCSGVIEMGRAEALLRMEKNARIEVHANARIDIYDSLLMEEGASLIVEPGAMLSVAGPLHIAKGSIMCIAAGVNFHHIATARINAPTLTVRDRHAMIGRFPVLPVTWSDKDKLFLVHLIGFLCRRRDVLCDLLLPSILPFICQRYGVLMTPSSLYKMQGKIWHKPRIPKHLWQE